MTDEELKGYAYQAANMIRPDFNRAFIGAVVEGEGLNRWQVLEAALIEKEGDGWHISREKKARIMHFMRMAHASNPFPPDAYVIGGGGILTRTANGVLESKEPGLFVSVETPQRVCILTQNLRTQAIEVLLCEHSEYEGQYKIFQD